MKYNDSVKMALLGGGAVVLPTDTIYGLVGSAFNKQTVERIYALRGRDRKKPMIILIGDVSDLELFSIEIGDIDREILEKEWPGSVSIVLPCNNNEYKYLHRGGKTLAFRLPDHDELRALLRVVGPLVAPSANPEGELPASTIQEAQDYFEDSVDEYVDGGQQLGAASRVISITDGEKTIIRK